VDVEVDGVTRGNELSEDTSLAERWVSSRLRSLFTYHQIFKKKISAKADRSQCRWKGKSSKCEILSQVLKTTPLFPKEYFRLDSCFAFRNKNIK
jgi:hypothetical protein